MNLKLWQNYAACWSAAADDRASALPTSASATVRYRDPNIEVAGIADLVSYMAGFAEAFPGHRFDILAVDAHHGRSLARWRQLDRNDQPVANGISTATHDESGKFAEITGFFPIDQP